MICSMECGDVELRLGGCDTRSSDYHSVGGRPHPPEIQGGRGGRAGERNISSRRNSLALWLFNSKLCPWGWGEGVEVKLLSVSTLYLCLL